MTILDKAMAVTGANRGIEQTVVEEAPSSGARRVDAGTRRPLAHPEGPVTLLTLEVTSAAQTQTPAFSKGRQPAATRPGTTSEVPR